MSARRSELTAVAGLAFLLGATASAGAQTPPTVSNPSFESTISPWAIWIGAGGNTDGLERDYTPAADGAFALAVKGIGSGGKGAYQYVSSGWTAGAAYRLGASVRNIANSGMTYSVGVAMGNPGTAGASGATWGPAVAGTSSWQRAICDFTYSGTSGVTLYLRVVNAGASERAGFDKVTIEAATSAPPPPPPSGTPDLVVDSVTSNPAAPTAGNGVTFSAVVRNAGTAGVASGTTLRVGFSVDGAAASAGTSTAGLAAGASVTVTASSVWTSTAGSHTVTAKADDPSGIAESSESNNALSAPLTVAAAPPPPSGAGMDPYADLVDLFRLATPLTGRTGQFSSDDRSGDSDNDYSWWTYLRTEPRRTVLADVRGPGCISRIWHGYKYDAAKARIEIYIDGAATPAVSALMVDFFGNLPPFTAPLAGPTSDGYVSYVPIPFRRGCRIEAIDAPDFNGHFYYDVSYRTYEPGEPIPESFAMPVSASMRARIDRFAQEWAGRGQDPKPAQAGGQTIAGTLPALAPGRTAVIAALPGAGTVTGLQLALSPAGADLANIRIRIRWDGAAACAVDAPLGGFFGSGVLATNGAPPPDAAGLPLGTQGGRMYNYFAMPFANGAVVELHNGSGATVDSAACTVGWVPQAASSVGRMRFHADARAARPARGSPYRVLDSTGRGHYLGCVLSVHSLDGTWTFLEGDEQIYVDGETSPSINGTGTEEYFNGGLYMGGGPYAQPFSGCSVRDATTHSLSAYRLCVTDPVVFRNGIVVNLEHGASSPTLINTANADYASTAFFYRDDAAGATPPPPVYAVAPEGALANGDFEGGFGGANGGEAAGWLAWQSTRYYGYTLCAFAPGTAAFSGARSQQITLAAPTVNDQAAGVAQQIPVAKGFTYQVTARFYLSLSGGAVAGQAVPRLGLGPSGNTNPEDPAIVWADGPTAPNAWNTVTVSATATTDFLTVFAGGLRRYNTPGTMIVTVDAVTLARAGTTPPPPPPPPSGPTGEPAVLADGTLRWEAENYTGGTTAVSGGDYFDSTAGNSGGQYRTQNVDIEACAEGGYDIGWTAAGEWTRYTFTGGGTWQLQVRYAGTSTATVHVEVDGANVGGALPLPATGGWQTWATATGATFTVPSAAHAVRFVSDSAGYNVNFFCFKPAPPPPPPPAGQPDVVIDSLSASPSPATAGQTMSFTAVVRNAGTAATPSGVLVGVGFKVDGAAVSSGVVTGPLAAGATATITSQAGPWTAVAGGHLLLATVDDVNRFAESNEGNNTLSISFNVASASPSPAPATPPAIVNPGFESGIVPWTMWVGSGGNADGLERDYAAAADGSFVLAVKGIGAGGKGAYQYVASGWVPGTVYRVGASVRNLSNSGLSYAVGVASGNPGTSSATWGVAVTGSSAWQRATVDFTYAGTGDLTIYLRAVNAGSSERAGFDKITVEVLGASTAPPPTPPPTGGTTLASKYQMVVSAPGVISGKSFTAPINLSGEWLCLYETCGTAQGGEAYGGAILVTCDGVTIENCTFDGGVIGIAAANVKNLTIRNCTFRSQSAWGVYFRNVNESVIEGCRLIDSVRSCAQSPDGCEAASILFINSHRNRLTGNYMYNGGDGVYFNGDGLPSHDNLIEYNEIVACPHNGIEITFSHGNVLDSNNIHNDVSTGKACLYPVWMGGSDITIRTNNRFACIFSLQRAIADSTASTSVPTIVRQ